MPLTRLPLVRDSYLGTPGGAARFLAGVALATNGENHVDLDVSGFDNLTVVASMTGAAATDLALAVFAIESDGSTPETVVAVPPALSGTEAVSGGHVAQILQYDLRGLRWVRVSVTNKNAAGQTVDFVDVFAGNTGVDF